jgi:ATP-dependent protease ClpP protease subunit
MKSMCMCLPSHKPISFAKAPMATSTGTDFKSISKSVQINTVGIGVAYGQCAMILSAGTPGKRYMLEHATAMLLQPSVPPTGARQAIEIQIRWREANAQYQNHLEILSRTTGHTKEKLDYDMQRSALLSSHLCRVIAILKSCMQGPQTLY